MCTVWILNSKLELIIFKRVSLRRRAGNEKNILKQKKNNNYKLLHPMKLFIIGTIVIFRLFITLRYIFLCSLSLSSFTHWDQITRAKEAKSKRSRKEKNRLPLKKSDICIEENTAGGKWCTYNEVQNAECKELTALKWIYLLWAADMYLTSSRVFCSRCFFGSNTYLSIAHGANLFCVAESKEWRGWEKNLLKIACMVSSQFKRKSNYDGVCEFVFFHLQPSSFTRFNVCMR